MTTNKDAVRLMRCPFCGSDKVGIDSEHDSDTGGVFLSVKCSSCRASSGAGFSTNPCPQTYQEVRDEWNRRAPASEVQADHIADERTDALCDSSYCAGLQQGFTFGQQDDNEGLHKALAARDGYVTVLREARALLSASKPAASIGKIWATGRPGDYAFAPATDAPVIPYVGMDVYAASPAVPAQSGEPYAYEIGAPDRTQELVYPAYLERYATEEERALPRLALYATPQPAQTVQSREDVLEKAAALCDQLAGEFPGGAADLCAKTLRRFNEQLDERETRQ